MRYNKKRQARKIRAVQSKKSSARKPMAKKVTKMQLPGTRL